MAEDLKMPEKLSHIEIDNSYDAPTEPKKEVKEVKAEKKPEVKPEIKTEEKPVIKAEEVKPVTPIDAPKPVEPPVSTFPERPAPEAPKPEDILSEQQRLAKEALEDKLRANAAEARLKALEPKVNVPEKEPDINDQTTWGDKYKNEPNDLTTFLKAHTEWAQEQGKTAERNIYKQQQAEKEQMAIKVAVMQKEQESRAKHPDYDAVIMPVVPVFSQVPILKDFIAKNPMGTEVAYELARNPVVLRSLLQSDVWAAGEQLLTMAARLKQPAKPQITQAPAPMTPVGSNEVSGKEDYAELAAKNTAAFIEKRKADRIKRARIN